jgi:hypothetical protein
MDNYTAVLKSVNMLEISYMIHVVKILHVD